jgi:hypothetical protein
MTNLFPNSNLSTASQPWGREVEKRLVNLDLTVKSNEINNSARDLQLANSLTRVNAALINAQSAANAAQSAADLAQDAIDNITSVEEAVYYPGTTEIDGGNIRANTIAANKISAGELVGFDIKTATTGQRVQMASNRIDFYDSANNYAGGMFGTTSGLGAAIEISGNIGVSGTSGFNGAVTMLSGLAVTGAISATTSVTAASFSTTGAVSAGSVSTSGAINAVGSINTDGGLTRTVYAGGGTTGASINNNGTIIRTTSSSRYKQDISALEFNYEDILALEPKKFRLKEEAADNNEARYYAGFIAEEIAQTPLNIFVGYQQTEDGGTRPDSVYYPELTTALLSAIKHQDGIIKSLMGRIEVLENR